MARRLLLLNESYRRTQSYTPIPALDRYTGVFFEVLKKAVREHPKETRDLDVLILTKEGELFRSEENAPYYPPLGQGYRHSLLKVDPSKRAMIMSKLLKVIEGKRYSEIFVNIGKNYRPLIEGFDAKANVKIEYAKGPGLGPKAGDMKRWLIGEKRFYT